jgi:serine/threonine protein kinase
MSLTSAIWWTDQRVDETVTSAYVHSHLRPNEQALLRRPLYFGGDLTDDTYLDWILTRAKRFFLILVAIGTPDQIFGIVDDSYDDEDLPIIEEAVPDLRLSYEPDRSLNKRFYKNQFRFLTRVVGEGEHIRYADEETVPIVALSLKSAILSHSHEGTDKVRLPTQASKVYLRRRFYVDAQLTEEQILNEIAASRKLCHEHVLSVFGSYLHQDSFNVLSLPAAEWSLKTFLTDTPKSFGNLPKPTRRETLINWPHCLASALAWLHYNGESHGAVRPSNIQVDETFHISLGLLDGDGLLRDRARSDDIEAYQYGPPERWKRAVTVQSTGSAAVALPSGGRTARRIDSKEKQRSSDSKTASWSGSNSAAAAYTFQPTSRGNYARLRLSAAMGPDVRSQPSNRGRIVNRPTDNNSISTQGTARAAFSPTSPGRPPSIISSNSSHGAKAASVLSGPIFVAAPESRKAVVQTWHSVEQDMFASDVFSLGAVMLDILTVLCKKSYSSFARHRSSKNRMAGRGGGLADASFHANSGQIFVWAQTLQNDAEKRAKKDEGQVYHAVGPVIQLALQCLEKDPATRLTSKQLERRLGENISHFAGVSHLHCAKEMKKESTGPTIASARQRHSPHMLRQENASIDSLRQIPPHPRGPAATWKQQKRGESAEGKSLVSPLSGSSHSTNATPRITPASSLASFNFDGLSDTVVAESPRSHEHPSRQAHHFKEPPRSQRDAPWSNDHEHAKAPAQWDTWHNNDSQVDPRLSFGESIDTGAFTYLNYSTSASSEEGVKYYSRSSAWPPTRAPTRELPPVPTIPPKIKSPKSNGSMRSARRDAAISKSFPFATSAAYPRRNDSLPKLTDLDDYNDEKEDDDDGDDDYHAVLRHTRRVDLSKPTTRDRSRQNRGVAGS